MIRQMIPHFQRERKKIGHKQDHQKEEDQDVFFNLEIEGIHKKGMLK